MMSAHKYSALAIWSHLHLRVVCIGCSKYPEKDLVQKLALLFWTFHYAKRILETFFVHRCTIRA